MEVPANIIGMKMGVLPWKGPLDLARGVLAAWRCPLLP